MKPAQIRKALRELALAREFPGTFCPSEVARALAEDWRPLMPAVRAAASRLITEGELECLQHGSVVAIENAVGPIRLRQTQNHL